MAAVLLGGSACVPHSGEGCGLGNGRPEAQSPGNLDPLPCLRSQRPWVDGASIVHGPWSGLRLVLFALWYPVLDPTPGYSIGTAACVCPLQAGPVSEAGPSLVLISLRASTGVTLCMRTMVSVSNVCLLLLIRTHKGLAHGGTQ